MIESARDHSEEGEDDLLRIGKFRRKVRHEVKEWLLWRWLFDARVGRWSECASYRLHLPCRASLSLQWSRSATSATRCTSNLSLLAAQANLTFDGQLEFQPGVPAAGARKVLAIPAGTAEWPEATAARRKAGVHSAESAAW
jgi:hypothetical protein